MNKTNLLANLLISLLILSIPASAQSLSIPQINPSSGTTQTNTPAVNQPSKNVITNEFTGSLTYTHNIEVPQGINNLQPTLTLNYNHQATHQQPTILGNTWDITTNKITKNQNNTPQNTQDDQYALQFQGLHSPLTYNNQTNTYHTQPETYTRIKKLTNNNQTYFEITQKDGTKHTLGKKPNSKLTINTTTLEWHLDTTTDTTNNNIHYQYTTYPDETNKKHIKQIEYNNNNTLIILTHEGPKQNNITYYAQNHPEKTTRTLSKITTYHNNNQIKSYTLNYTKIGNRNLLQIAEKNDNTIILKTKPEKSQQQ